MKGDESHVDGAGVIKGFKVTEIVSLDDIEASERKVLRVEDVMVANSNGIVHLEELAIIEKDKVKVELGPILDTRESTLEYTTIPSLHSSKDSSVKSDRKTLPEVFVSHVSTEKLVMEISLGDSEILTEAVGDREDVILSRFSSPVDSPKSIKNQSIQSGIPKSTKKTYSTYSSSSSSSSSATSCSSCGSKCTVPLRDKDRPFHGIPEHIVKCNDDGRHFHMRRRKRRYGQQRVKLTASYSMTESPKTSPKRALSPKVSTSSPRRQSSPANATTSSKDRSSSRSVVPLKSPLPVATMSDSTRRISLQDRHMSQRSSNSHDYYTAPLFPLESSFTPGDSYEKSSRQITEIKHPVQVCKRKKTKVKIKKNKINTLSVDSHYDEKIILTPPKEKFVSTSGELGEVLGRRRHNQRHEPRRKSVNDQLNRPDHIKIEGEMDMRFCLRQCLYYGGANP